MPLQRTFPSKLRAGVWVEIRSEEEILSSLDTDASLEKLPFMPEMLRYCGQRFRISAIAHKTCDPAHKTGGRKLENTVHLEGLLCDGASHGGCQAACLLFWKTAWLKPIASASPQEQSSTGTPPLSRRDLERATTNGANGQHTRYICQATQLFAATRLLHWWDPRQYIRDLTSGNVTLAHMLRVLVLSWALLLTRIGIGYRLTTAFYDRLHRLLLKRPAPKVGGTIPLGQPTPRDDLHLQPNETVRIKSNAAILNTLNKSSMNRGLWFDEEMAAYCGGVHRVWQRVDRIINEKTGEMMEMKSPCITLDGVVCRSICSRWRRFCPRAITPYWRETWLERVPEREND